MELTEGLWVALGFKADTLKLKEFMSAIGDLDMRTVAAALGLRTLYDATNKIMNIADATAMSMFGFSQVTGMSGEKMEQLSSLTKQFGGSAQDAQASLKGLQAAMLQAQLHGGGMAFVLAHIDPFKDTDTFEVLAKIQKFLKSGEYTDAIKRMVVAQLGMSESMIPLLKNTKDINEAIKEQIHISPESEQALFRQTMAWNKLSGEWQVVVTDIGGAIAPGLQKIAEGFDTIVVAIHKSPELVHAIEGIAVAIGIVTIALTAMGIAMAGVSLVAWLTGLPELVLAFGALVTVTGLLVANLDKLPKFTEHPFSSISEVAMAPSSAVLGQLAGNNQVVNNTIEVVVHAAEAGVKDIGSHIAEKIQEMLDHRYRNTPNRSI